MKYNVEKLKAYGFTGEKEYVLKRTYDNLIITLVASDEGLVEHVEDEDTNDVFLPYFQTTYGSYVGGVKEYVENLKADIESTCVDEDMISAIHTFIKEEFGVEGRCPFSDFESIGYYTLENNKWFCLEMSCVPKNLGLEGTGKIKVLNIKVEPEILTQKIDSVHYFKAYHMNKSKWMSILVDGDSDLEEVKELLRQSYKLVK